ncbi:hypothetical protein [Nitrospirillum iridis]|uniref:Uncharacterized protein n=1 Tax=Nitrospirillum iridis TaxID=765888 RepID=A0A7X0AYX7_9PROT|nr:hypothetical protein [Nitrospirillum iridis]MBB6252708.1 hypothetical protein [Nitrospirillum iridis]
MCYQGTEQRWREDDVVGARIRKVMLFIVMALMIGGGAYIIDRQIVSHHAIFWRGLAMGGFLMAFGLYVLVDDFLKPIARRLKTDRSDA